MITHQYIVGYYVGKPSSIITWRDILTNKLYRHDGPCYYLSRDCPAPCSVIKHHNDISESLEDSINSYEINSKVKLTHQYVVSYYDNKIAIFITWKDILTGEICRHDGGPAEYCIQDFTVLVKPEYSFVFSKSISLDEIEPRFND